NWFARGIHGGQLLSARRVDEYLGGFVVVRGSDHRHYLTDDNPRGAQKPQRSHSPGGGYRGLLCRFSAHVYVVLADGERSMTQTDYTRHEHHEFLAASDLALANPNLQIALSRLGDTLGQRNRDAWRLLPESDLLRERARAIKDETLAHLDEHLLE